MNFHTAFKTSLIFSICGELVESIMILYYYFFQMKLISKEFALRLTPDILTYHVRTCWKKDAIK